MLGRGKFHHEDTKAVARIEFWKIEIESEVVYENDFGMDKSTECRGRPDTLVAMAGILLVASSYVGGGCISVPCSSRI
jgi:hypothetical protein